MGLFDSVYVQCPNCGNLIEFQSKAGSCDLKKYHLQTAPPEILGDISRDSEHCKKCGETIAIKVVCMAMPYVKSKFIENETDDG